MNIALRAAILLAVFSISMSAFSQKTYYGIKLNSIFSEQTTENNPLNNRDEIYIVCTGGTSKGVKIAQPRISPPAPEDYYGLKKGQQAKNINLTTIGLEKNESAVLQYVVREQDNAQLSSIAKAVAGGAALVTGILLENPEIISIGADALIKAGKDFVKSLSTDGDDTIGSFEVQIQNNTTPVIKWKGISGVTRMDKSSGTSNYIVVSGRGGTYRLSLNVGISTNTPKPQYTYVGTTKDGCDGGNVVTVNGVAIHRNQTRRIDLGYNETELTWYCGNSKQRVANDVSFNVVDVTRAQNGAITWRFYRKS